MAAEQGPIEKSGRLLLKNFRRGFTLIEVLVSVVLISVVVLGIAKIRDQNIEAARYISARISHELENSLFLAKGTEGYRAKEKSAYELMRGMKINKTQSRQILKEIRRTITVSKPLPIGKAPLPLEVRSIVLKGEYSARFYRLFSNNISDLEETYRNP